MDFSFEGTGKQGIRVFEKKEIFFGYGVRAVWRRLLESSEALALRECLAGLLMFGHAFGFDAKDLEFQG